MLTDLLSIIASPMFEDDGGSVRIISADWFADDLHLDLAVSPHDESPAQFWELELGAVREEAISSAEEDNFIVTQSHPVLLPYKEDSLNVFFKGLAVAPLQLEGLILEAHLSVVGEWLPLSKFINAMGLSKIVREQFGLLGRAPESLARRYLQALESAGVHGTLTDKFPPKRWTGTEWVAESPELKAVIIGKSYVICESISANRA